MAASANHSTGDASPTTRSPVPSPWNSQIATSADFPDDSALNRAESGADGGKRPAWNKPSNGAAEMGPVMGAELWPALSELTRASTKASSSDSPKPDGSVTLQQGSAVVHPSISHNQVMENNVNSSLAHPNHVVPTRQKSMKRSGGGGGSSSGNNIANRIFPQPSPSPSTTASDMQPNIIGKSEPTVTELSPRDRTHKESGQRGVGSPSRSGNDHIHRNDSFKKGNSGAHHRNFGGRGHQDRGNHEWNSQRSFNGRDSHLQQQRVSPRGFGPPTHASASFVHPQPVTIRPYPVVYPDVPPQMFYYVPPPESLRGVPLVAPMPPPAMYYAVSDPLIPKIVHQIDYYFSDENLVKDTYLRGNMDDQGWVPVQLIASFKKGRVSLHGNLWVTDSSVGNNCSGNRGQVVYIRPSETLRPCNAGVMSQLTENIPLILEAIHASSVVEVQGDKIRRRSDWYRWILPAVQSPNVSSPQAQGSYNHEMLIANAQNLSLEEKTSYQGQIASYSRSSSGEFSQSQAPGPAAIGGGPERTVSARSPSE